LHDDDDDTINVYIAVIMTRPLLELTRFIQWMLTERQAADIPRSAEANGLGLQVRL